MQIIPSLVEQTAHDIFERMTFLSPFYHVFQVDIEDGIFITNKTLTTVEFVEYALSQKNTLPPQTIFDFHLMVHNPENHIKLISQLPQKQIGVIFIHNSVFPDYKLLTTNYPLFSFGLVLNPNEEVASIPHQFIDTLPAIQLMTVYPGKQGQPFIKNVMNKIEQLRKGGYQGKIYIDGAVNGDTYPYINSLMNKPDVLCPGSYLAKSPKEELEKRVNFLSRE